MEHRNRFSLNFVDEENKETKANNMPNMDEDAQLIAHAKKKKGSVDSHMTFGDDIDKSLFSVKP